MTEIPRRTRRGRPEMYQFWRSVTHHLFADDEKLSAVDAYGMLRAIRDENPELKDKPLPADDRTVSRWKKRFFEEHPTREDRSLYRTYRWPDAHLTGTVPFEAAKISFEILRSRLTHGEDLPHQSMDVLTESQALWAYRLRLAHPTWPLESIIEASETFDPLRPKEGR